MATRQNGTAGSDSLVGTEGDDIIVAYGGSDTVDGGPGNDYLDGGIGNDTLIGAGGNDFLIGGKGDDVSEGNLGADQFRFYGYNITGAGTATPGHDTDTVLDLNFAEGDLLSFPDYAAGTFQGTGVYQQLNIVDTGQGPGSGANVRSWAGLVDLVNASPAVTAARKPGTDDLVIEITTQDGAIQTIVVRGGWPNYVEAGGGPQNQPPTANADAATTGEDSSTTFNVLANDTDPNGDALTVTGAAITSGPGTLAWSADGTFTYDPAGAFDHLAVGQSATVEITYTIADGQGGTATATARVTVQGVNDGPVAAADAAAGTENQALTIDVLANDTDVDDGAVLTLLSGQAPAGKGSVSVAAGQLVFDPGTDFDHLAEGASETVTLTYVIEDEHGAQSTSTVTVTVTGTNDGPSAKNDAVTTGEDSPPVTFAVLANDTDPDTGDALTVTAATVTSGAGTVVINPNGTLTYDSKGAYNSLAAGESANVEITYQISDGHGGTASAKAIVTVTGANDGPNAVANKVAVNEDATSANLWTTLLANDKDPDASDVLTIKSVDTTGTKGSVIFDAATKTLKYVADADDFDLLCTGQKVTDTFTYTVVDKSGATSVATVTVDVTGVGDGKLILGDCRPNTLAGTNGEDLILGFSQNDTIAGGEGSDTIFGCDGNDKISGNNGIDFLFGDFGKDTLDGGAGNDHLNGGFGDDLLTGGLGRDTFEFFWGSGKDTITDFKIGEDRLDFDFVSVRSFKGIDTDGNKSVDSTLLTLTEGSTITLKGIVGLTDWHVLI